MGLSEEENLVGRGLEGAELRVLSVMAEETVRVEFWPFSEDDVLRFLDDEKAGEPCLGADEVVSEAAARLNGKLVGALEEGLVAREVSTQEAGKVDSLWEEGMIPGMWGDLWDGGFAGDTSDSRRAEEELGGSCSESGKARGLANFLCLDRGEGSGEGPRPGCLSDWTEAMVKGWRGGRGEGRGGRECTVAPGEPASRSQSGWTDG